MKKLHLRAGETREISGLPRVAELFAPEMDGSLTVIPPRRSVVQTPTVSPPKISLLLLMQIRTQVDKTREGRGTWLKFNSMSPPEEVGAAALRPLHKAAQTYLCCETWRTEDTTQKERSSQSRHTPGHYTPFPETAWGEKKRIFFN